MDEIDRCELCGYRSDGTFRDRMRHLKSKHPGYHRGLLLRLVSPVVFLIATLALAAFHAPQWAYLAALFVSFGSLFAGKIKSRTERSRAGARSTLGIRRLLSQGGLGFVLIVPAVAILLILMGFLSQR